MSLKDKLIQLKNKLIVNNKDEKNFEKIVKTKKEDKLKLKAEACDELISQIIPIKCDDISVKENFINLIKSYKESEKLEFTFFSYDVENCSISYYLAYRESRIKLIVRNFDFRLSAASHDYYDTPEKMLSKYELLTKTETIDIQSTDNINTSIKK